MKKNLCHNLRDWRRNPFVYGALLLATALQPAVAAPKLVTTVLPVPVVGKSYSASVLVGSPLTITSFNVTGMPPGLSTAWLVGSGAISIVGTPTVKGTYQMSVSASDASGTLTTPLDLQVFIDDSMSAASAAAGGYHTCAVVAGGVQCWGRNNHGQLGNGRTLDSTTPIEVANVNKVTAVAAGMGHTCAVASGGLKCWGDNAAGQLGAGNFGDSPLPLETFPTGSGILAVSLGARHGCAIADGGLKCWGNNSIGQLGTGNNASTILPLTVFAPGSQVSAVAAGSQHTCAIVNAGVKCWGSNFAGQLGNGTITDSNMPVDTIPAGSQVTSIAAGPFHTCVVMAGQIRCWGSNDSGQLGDASGSVMQTSPVLAPSAGSNNTAVSAGNAHTCSVAGGGLLCWGNNQFGQLGDGTTTSSDTPRQILASSDGIISVNAGLFHTCALTPSLMRCWGANSQGQLGNGKSAKSLLPAFSSAGSAAGSVVTAMAGGSGHICSLELGGVRCQGLNGGGQLGNNSTVPSTTPVQAVPSGSGTTALAARLVHACALVNGGVKCWGNDNMTQRLVPTQMIPAGSLTSAIAVGDYHACAVVDGGAQCWGNNEFGQVGIGTAAAYIAAPAQVLPAGSGVTAIGAGSSHSCAVVNGGVQCWGRNAIGQLGNGTTVDSRVPVESLPAGSNAQSVGGGEFHTCARVGDGVRCWGGNRSAELNYAGPDSLVPTEALPAGSGVTAIAVGPGHTCAVLLGGMSCWGRNSSGQLGGGAPYADSLLVQAVPGGANALSAMAAATVSCALLSSGVACWGEGEYGQAAVAYFSGMELQPVKPLLLAFPLLKKVYSRKTHAGGVVCDIPIDTNLSPPYVTTDPRASTHGHTIILEFDRPTSLLESIAVGSTGSGGGGGPFFSINRQGNNIVVKTPDHYPDHLLLAVEANAAGGRPYVGPIWLGALLGDVGSGGIVSASDISYVKQQAGKPLNTQNCRADVDLSGQIDADDLTMARARAGNSF